MSMLAKTKSKSVVNTLICESDEAHTLILIYTEVP